MCRMLVNQWSPHGEISWTPIHKVQVVDAAIVGDVYRNLYQTAATSNLLFCQCIGTRSIDWLS